MNRVQKGHKKLKILKLKFDLTPILQRITSSGSNPNKNSRLQLSSDEGVSPRSKAEQRKKWIKSKKNHPDYLSSRPDSQSTMPLSESRDR